MLQIFDESNITILHEGAPNSLIHTLFAHCSPIWKNSHFSPPFITRCVSKHHFTIVTSAGPGIVTITLLKYFVG